MVNDAPTTEPIFNGFQLVIGCGCFILLVLLVGVLKKIWFRYRYQKRYFVIPRISVKGITNIGLVISISVAVICILTIVTAGTLSIVFRSFPGSRISIEGILIKIGGLLFGPIIGVFVGAMTDLLTIALTAGIFHYGYFCCAIMHGLIGGLIRSLLNMTKNNRAKFSVYSTIIMIFVLAGLIVYIFLQKANSFEFTLLNQAIHISKFFLIALVSSMFFMGFAILWTCTIVYYHCSIRLFFVRYRYNFFVYHKIKKNNKADRKGKADVQYQLLWISKHAQELAKIKNEYYRSTNTINWQYTHRNWFDYFSPVLVMLLITESFNEIVMLPIFDVNFSPLSFDHWLAMRSLSFVVLLVLNLAVIFPVFKIVDKSLKYSYRDDLIEKITKPIFVE